MAQQRAKGGELLKPEDGDDDHTPFIEAIARLAEPFAKAQSETARTAADAQIATAKEHTRQLIAQLDASREVERRGAWLEFAVIAFACVAYGACVAMGLWRDNNPLLTIGISGLGSFLAGLGIGARKHKPG